MVQIIFAIRFHKIDEACGSGKREEDEDWENF